jgi:hypothetical protein
VPVNRTTTRVKKAVWEKEVDVMSHKATARTVGVLYIVATAASILSYLFVGSLDAPDYLVEVSANENQVLVGMLIQLTWALAVLGIPVVLFPILKLYGETWALGFFSLRFMEAMLSIVYIMVQLSLLTLSLAFVEAGVADASAYEASGTLLLAARDWALLIGPGLVFILSALVLNYVLFQTRLVPRWLSVWGLLGAALWLVNWFLQFFGIHVADFLFVPIAVQEMVFAVWLIVKGFDSAVIESLSADEN